MKANECRATDLQLISKFTTPILGSCLEAVADIVYIRGKGFHSVLDSGIVPCE